MQSPVLATVELSVCLFVLPYIGLLAHYLSRVTAVLGKHSNEMTMIFIWQRSQATRKGTSPSMLAARTKKILYVNIINIISIINIINN